MYRRHCVLFCVCLWIARVIRWLPLGWMFSGRESVRAAAVTREKPRHWRFKTTIFPVSKCFLCYMTYNTEYYLTDLKISRTVQRLQAAGTAWKMRQRLIPWCRIGERETDHARNTHTIIQVCLNTLIFPQQSST